MVSINLHESGVNFKFLISPLKLVDSPLLTQTLESIYSNFY